MAIENYKEWLQGEFEIAGRSGPYRVFGLTCGGFGLFDCAQSGGGASRVTYLTSLVTGEVLATFATRREARLAAQAM
ncbi:hypothetical protein [Hyphomicrobium sp.]|uniref:hypothetical protein n=1 Tax=Hyphomicrobium sp. TaxID=82 RepID=UPI002FE01ED5